MLIATEALMEPLCEQLGSQSCSDVMLYGEQNERQNPKAVKTAQHGYNQTCNRWMMEA
jgi:hypothetical protein